MYKELEKFYDFAQACYDEGVKEQAFLYELFEGETDARHDGNKDIKKAKILKDYLPIDFYGGYVRLTMPVGYGPTGEDLQKLQKICDKFGLMYNIMPFSTLEFDEGQILQVRESYKKNNFCAFIFTEK